MWPDRRLLDLLEIEHPILLAPMAGAMDFELAVAVAEARRARVAALRHAQSPSRRASRSQKFRARTNRPVNMNFFCHTPPELNNAREARWRERLKPYYEELGIDPGGAGPDAACACRSTRRSARWSRR